MWARMTLNDLKMTMAVAESLTCFKAYDVRGKLGSELNEDIVYRIGRAYAQHLNAKCVVVGCDIRKSSDSLKQALTNGLMDAGVDVIDIGMTGTEEIYFAAFHLDVDGGIEVTASHNPMDYPCSGEINYRVDNVEATVARVFAHFNPQAPSIVYTDGLSMEFPSWRFNLRSSNTEPLLRLNVEARGSDKIVKHSIELIESLIEGKDA